MPSTPPGDSQPVAQPVHISLRRFAEQVETVAIAHDPCQQPVTHALPAEPQSRTAEPIRVPSPSVT